jgi:hypothetical protein
MRPYALLAAPLLALAIGCSGGTAPDARGNGDGAATPTTTSVPDARPPTTGSDPDAQPPSTEAPGPGGSVAEPSGGSTVVDRYGELGPLEAVAPSDGSDGNAGSGCRPDSTDRLPDGIWMTYVTTFSADTIAVDLLCYETNQSSVDGDVFEDWETKNESTQSRTVPLADGARIFLQTDPNFRPGETTETRPFDDPVAAGTFAAQSGDPTPMAWVLVEGGLVTEVYSPPLGSA